MPTSNKKDIKICPYCANEIKEWAKKCMYCKESLYGEKESDKLIGEVKPPKNKGLRILWWILALSIPIIAFLRIIISLIFWIIGASGWWSEVMITIKNFLNRILWMFATFSIFFTIWWIIILVNCK